MFRDVVVIALALEPLQQGLGDVVRDGFDQFFRAGGWVGADGLRVAGFPKVEVADDGRLHIAGVVDARLVVITRPFDDVVDLGLDAVAVEGYQDLVGGLWGFVRFGDDVLDRVLDDGTLLCLGVSPWSLRQRRSPDSFPGSTVNLLKLRVAPLY